MTIHIENLRFDCIIGILDFERKNKQNVIIDATLKYDYKEGFVDYAKIVKNIKKTMIKGKFGLIEDALQSIILSLNKKYPNIKKINIKITKPSILGECEVGVSMIYKYKS